MPKTTGEEQKRKVLVVDDDIDLAQVYKETLEKHGYSVTTAPNGVVALKYVLNREVDAIVCDLKMPQLEGDMFYLTVERMKPELCGRFIFITGMTENPKFQPFISSHAARVLFKPVTMEQLVGAVSALLARG